MGVAKLKTCGGGDAVPGSSHILVAIVVRDRNLKSLSANGTSTHPSQVILLTMDCLIKNAVRLSDTVNDGLSYQECGTITLPINIRPS